MTNDKAKPLRARVRWNPRFVIYARSHSHTPADMLVHDKKRFPGGRMAGFMLWISAQWSAFCSETNTPREYATLHQSEFDQWLTKTNERGTMSNLGRKQTEALVAWANEGDRQGGTTAYGPKFDAVMEVARAVRDGQPDTVSKPTPVDQLITELRQGAKHSTMDEKPLTAECQKEAADKLIELQREIDRKTKALQQYADVNNWYGEKGDDYVAGQHADPGTLLTWDGPGAADDDGPTLARQALEGDDDT